MNIKVMETTVRAMIRIAAANPKEFRITKNSPTTATSTPSIITAVNSFTNFFNFSKIYSIL